MKLKKFIQNYETFSYLELLCIERSFLVFLCSYMLLLFYNMNGFMLNMENLENLECRPFLGKFRESLE